MSLNEKIYAELKWISGFERHVAELLHDSGLNSQPRTIAAGTLYSLCFETASSIPVLTREGRIGSAMSLIRITIESYIRGSWLHHCASMDAVRKAVLGDDTWAKLGVGSMVKAIEANGPSDVISIIEAMDQYVDRGLRHSLAHGGSQHILGRFDGQRIGVIYSNDNIVAMLRLATVTMCASGFGAADLAGRRDAKDKIAQLFGVLVRESMAIEGAKLTL